MNAPAIQSPADLSTGVDHKAPIVILLDEYVPEAGVATTAVSIPAQNVEDPLASAGWTDPAKFLATTGNQNDMASAVEVWRNNRINWRAYGGWPADPSRVVTFVEGRCYALRETASSSTWVMWNVIYENEHRANIIFAHQGAVWTGSGAATLQTNGGTRPVQMFEVLEAILGPRFTLDQLRLLLDERDPDDTSDTALANFRVALHPYSYYGEVGAGYHASGMELRVTYLDDDPIYQGGFEIQVSTSPFFVTVAWERTVYGNYRSTAIPANTLAANTPYFVRARRFGQDSPATYSSWTLTQFQTVAEGTAALAHAQGMGTPVYELHHGHWLIGSECRLETRTVVDPADGSPVDPTHVYRTSLLRSAMPVSNWWIDPMWEENALPVAWTECFSIAEVETTLRGWFHDEKSLEGPPGELYFRPPYAPSGYGSFGLMVSLVQPVSDTAGVRCGPGMRYTADPWVMKHPSVSYSIEDVTEEVANEPEGSIVLSNPEWPEDAQHRRVWDMAIGEPDTFGNIGREKLVMYRRRIRGALCGTPGFPIPYAERMSLFDGLYSWDEENLVSATEVSFRVHGREHQEAPPIYRIDGLGGETAASGDRLGEAPQDAVGAAQGLIPIYIGGGGSNIWRVGKHVTAISEWRVNGSPVGFSLNVGTHTVTESGAASPTAFARSYDASATGSAPTMYPTDLAIEVLTEHAVPAYPVGDINQTSFDLVKAWHATFPPSWDLSECALPITEPNTSGLRVIRTLENSGLFHVCRRQNGQVVATRSVPEGVDAFTLFLSPADLLSEIVATIDSSRVSQHIVTTFSGKRSDGSGYSASWVAPGLWPESQMKRVVHHEIESAHTTTNGADWVWAHARPFEALRGYVVDVSRRAAFAFAGGTVVLTVPRGKSDDGVLDFELCKILELTPTLPSCDRWHLKCQWIRRIATAERPFAS